MALHFINRKARTKNKDARRQERRITFFYSGELRGEFIHLLLFVLPCSWSNVSPGLSSIGCVPRLEAAVVILVRRICEGRGWICKGGREEKEGANKQAVPSLLSQVVKT